MPELAGLLIAFILTLFVYSYIWRDNFLYRLAVHVLVGVSAGYAAVIVTQQLFLPVLADPAGVNPLLWVVPAVFAFLLLLKLLRPVAWVGNSAVALLVGVGAAVALMGAVVGTLLPQITAVYDNAFWGLVTALATICTLLYFHFTGRLTAEGDVVLPVWQRYPAIVGRVVLTITFAALFAGLLNTSIVLLSGRVGFFVVRLLELVE